MNPDDLVKQIEEQLADELVALTGKARAEYAQFIRDMAPLVARYAQLAAAGDPIAAANLEHLRAQAQAKAAVMQIAVQSTTNDMVGTIIGTVAAAAVKAMI